MLLEIVDEAIDVEPELARVAHQGSWRQVVLMLEQEVVHLPERALRRGSLARLGRELRVRVDVVERQVAPDVADVAGVAQQLAQHRLGLPAVGTLEVPVLDERDRRLFGAANVISLGIDRHREIDQRLRCAEQRADAQALRQEHGRAEDEPRQHRGAERGAEHAELGLRELLAPERNGGDQQRDGEADPGDRAAAGERRPADRRAQTSATQLRHEQRRAQDAGRLAGDVTDQDAERDGRRERVREELPVDVDARVRKREQRHDHVARPRMKALLGAFVRRECGSHAEPRRPGELGRRLLAEQPEEIGGALEVAAGRRRRERQQPHRQPDHDRVDAGLREGVPGEHPEHGVDAAATDAERDCKHHDDGEEPDRRQQRHDVE